jgi:DNA-directed RNA polymerase II subunit RPB1
MLEDLQKLAPPEPQEVFHIPPTHFTGFAGYGMDYGLKPEPEGGKTPPFYPSSPQPPKKHTSLYDDDIQMSKTPEYMPSSPNPSPKETKAYKPSEFRPSSPAYRPSSPAYKPSSPAYKPSSPVFSPESPKSPLFSSSPEEGETKQEKETRSIAETKPIALEPVAVNPMTMETDAQEAKPSLLKKLLSTIHLPASHPLSKPPTPMSKPPTPVSKMTPLIDYKDI